ncbi:MAG: PD-(D/E)XK nuclease family transposase, partial [Planctomycetaceae bacterium]|nr:PD-(D/E)XK nuclease family transposase [Planctomycetaceae bacterium]
FTKTESELQDQKDKWLYFLKNLESFDDIPAILHEPVFEKAFDLAEYLKYSPALQEAYQNNLKVYRDNKNVLETARTEGEAKGFDAGKTEGKAEGKAEGLKEGKAKGLKEGMELGEAKRETEITRKLKAMGLSIPDIAKATGLSIPDIKKL